MIHKIQDYSCTLTSPDTGEGCSEITYRPLVEMVCCNQKDIDDCARKLRLILKNGVRPVVTIFEVDRIRRYL